VRSCATEQTNHDRLAIDIGILDVLQPLNHVTEFFLGLRGLSKAIDNQISYVLDDNDLVLSEEGLKKLEKVARSWVNSAVVACFSTWHLVAGLSKVGLGFGVWGLGFVSAVVACFSTWHLVAGLSKVGLGFGV